jgi:hypothetical protein
MRKKQEKINDIEQGIFLNFIRKEGISFELLTATPASADIPSLKAFVLIKRRQRAVRDMKE